MRRLTRRVSVIKMTNRMRLRLLYVRRCNALTPLLQFAVDLLYNLFIQLYSS